jgi:hypothetical protein
MTIGTDPDVDLLLRQQEPGTSLMASLWHISKARVRCGLHRWITDFVPHELVGEVWNGTQTCVRWTPFTYLQMLIHVLSVLVLGFYVTMFSLTFTASIDCVNCISHSFQKADSLA